MKLLAFKGGEGSGNFGHHGRPGQVGGSAPDYAGSYSDEDQRKINAGLRRLAAEWRVPISTIPRDIALNFMNNVYDLTTAHDVMTTRADAQLRLETNEWRQRMEDDPDREDKIINGRRALVNLTATNYDDIPADIAYRYNADSNYLGSDAMHEMTARAERAARINSTASVPEPHTTVWQDMVNADPTDSRIDVGRRTLLTHQTVLPPGTVIPDDIALRYHVDDAYTFQNAVDDIHARAQAQDILDTVGRNNVSTPATIATSTPDPFGDAVRIGQARDMLANTHGMNANDITDAMALSYARGEATPSQIAQQMRDVRVQRGRELLSKDFGIPGAAIPEDVVSNYMRGLYTAEDVNDRLVSRGIITADAGHIDENGAYVRNDSSVYGFMPPLTVAAASTLSSDQVNAARARLAISTNVPFRDIPESVAQDYARGAVTLAMARETIAATQTQAPVGSMGTSPTDDAQNRRYISDALGIPEDGIPLTVVRRYAAGQFSSDDEIRNAILDVALAPLQETGSTGDTNVDAILNRTPDIPTWTQDAQPAPRNRDYMEPYADQLLRRNFPVVARGDRNGDAFISVTMSTDQIARFRAMLEDKGFGRGTTNIGPSLYLGTEYGLFKVIFGDDGAMVSLHAESRAGNLTEAEWANVRTNVMDKWMYLLSQV